MAGGKRYTFKTSDEIILSGIKLASEKPTNAYILIIQGNGFPAGRVVQEFEEFQKLGLDVYGFDFRGYLWSQGKRRFWAMLQDYAEILAHLNSKYEKRFIYATSFGGVIAANIISNYELYDLVFFDSVVSRVSSIFTCDRNYDPVDKLPNTCRSLLVQGNSDDRFFRHGYLNELMAAAEKCGGKESLQWGFAHPFEENKKKILARMQRLRNLVRSRL